MALKILLADDDPLIREGLKIILGMDPEFEVVACVADGLQALNYCLKEEVEVALLDVRMPVMNGVQSTKEICSQTQTKVLILTTFDDQEFITQAIKNGAKGYLIKNNPPERIKDALKMVASGNTVMQDVVFDKFREGMQSREAEQFDEELFSERELEIIRLIAKGYSNKQIAQTLFITEGTVKNYITSVLNKTALEHRTQIAVYYLNGGKFYGEK